MSVVAGLLNVFVSMCLCVPFDQARYEVVLRQELGRLIM